MTIIVPPSNEWVNASGTSSTSASGGLTFASVTSKCQNSPINVDYSSNGTFFYFYFYNIILHEVITSYMSGIHTVAYMTLIHGMYPSNIIKLFKIEFLKEL